MGGMLAITLILALLAVAPAQAAPIVLDPRDNVQKPDVAVDSQGTGHLIWNQDTGNVDEIVYCRLPRAAQNCDRNRTFTFSAADQSDTLRPRVLVDSTDKVYILSSRCCEGTNRLYMIRSQDRGETWDAPRVVGSNEPSGGAAVGPGEFTISTISNITTGGTFFESFPIDGSASGKANVGDNPGGSNIESYGTLAISQSFTPVAAMSDVEDVYYRVGPGEPDYNSLSRWGPLKKLGPGTQPRLASGPRGVFLLFERVTNGTRRLMLSRFDPVAATFGTPVAVAGSADLRFGDIWQDSGGRIHVVWKNTDDALVHAVSKDGATFAAAETIGKANEGAWTQNEIAVAEDGGGFAVSDNLNDGPIVVVPFGPQGPVGSGDGDGGGDDEDGDCVPGFTLKKHAKVVAAEGCLKKVKGVYETTGDVRINGIEIVTPGAQASSRGIARASGNPVKVQIDRESGEVTTTGAVETLIGPVVLDRGKVDWTVPSTAGKEFFTFKDLEQYKVGFLGFPVVGDSDVKFVNGEARVSGHLRLPSWLANAVANVEFVATVEGLKLQGFHIHVESAQLGALLIRELDVLYDNDQGIFKGDVIWVLPPGLGDSPKVRGYFSMINGKFDRAGFNAPLPVPIVLTPAPVPVELTDIGFEFGIDPYRIKAGAKLRAAGGVITLDALPDPTDETVAIRMQFGDPVTLSAGGKLALLGIPFAKGSVGWEVPYKFTFGGEVDFSLPANLASFKGGTNGFLDLENGKFNAESPSELCVLDVGCLSGTLLLSSKGVAGCAMGGISVEDDDANDDGVKDDSSTFTLVSGALGFGATWTAIKNFDADGVSVFGDFEVGGDATCDVGPWRETDVSTAAVRAAQSGVPIKVNVPAGLPQVRIGLQGIDDAPLVRVTAPDGKSFSTGSDPSRPGGDERSYIFRHSALKLTQLVVMNPPAGEWTFTLEPESSDVTEVLRSDGLPEPSVKARVTGRGQRRQLVYTMKRIPGQRVTFQERSGSVASAIVGNRTASGSTSFRPAFGAGGRREIVALVESYGSPREEIVVGSYTAPDPGRLAKPRGVRLQRDRRGRVTVRWRRLSGARSYLVRVRLGDGTNQFRATKRTRLRIGGLDRRYAGTVTVAGIDIGARTGKAARAKVAKKKPKRRR